MPIPSGRRCSNEQCKAKLDHDFDFCPACGTANPTGMQVVNCKHPFDYARGPFCPYCGMLGNVKKVALRRRAGALMAWSLLIFYLEIYYRLRTFPSRTFLHDDFYPLIFWAGIVLASFLMGLGLLLRDETDSTGDEKPLPPHTHKSAMQAAMKMVTPQDDKPRRSFAERYRDGCLDRLLVGAAITASLVGWFVLNEGNPAGWLFFLGGLALAIWAMFWRVQNW